MIGGAVSKFNIAKVSLVVIGLFLIEQSIVVKKLCQCSFHIEI